jgi:hypothetical protein
MLEGKERGREGGRVRVRREFQAWREEQRIH